MGSKLGVLKIAAGRLGIPFSEYMERKANGQKWCTSCRQWLKTNEFGKNKLCGDGLSPSCLQCQRARGRKGYITKPRKSRAGQRLVTARDGDKDQARGRIHALINSGVIPCPNMLPCANCGHIYDGEQRHEYHHHKGYSAEHHDDVEVLCTTCHAQKDGAKRTGHRGGGKLTIANVIEIRRDYGKVTTAALARHYKVSSTTIYNIGQRRKWAYIPEQQE